MLNTNKDINKIYMLLQIFYLFKSKYEFKYTHNGNLVQRNKGCIILAAR